MNYERDYQESLSSKRMAAFQNEVKPRKHKSQSIETHPNQTGGVLFDDVPNF